MDRKTSKKELLQNYILITEFIKSNLGEDYTDQAERLGIPEWKMKNTRSRRRWPKAKEIADLLKTYNLTLDEVRHGMPLSIISTEIAEKDRIIKKLRDEIDSLKDKYTRTLEQLHGVES